MYLQMFGMKLFTNISTFAFYSKVLFVNLAPQVWLSFEYSHQMPSTKAKYDRSDGMNNTHPSLFEIWEEFF